MKCFNLPFPIILTSVDMSDPELVPRSSENIDDILIHGGLRALSI